MPKTISLYNLTTGKKRDHTRFSEQNTLEETLIERNHRSSRMLVFRDNLPEGRVLLQSRTAYNQWMCTKGEEKRGGIGRPKAKGKKERSVFKQKLSHKYCYNSLCFFLLGFGPHSTCLILVSSCWSSVNNITKVSP